MSKIIYPIIREILLTTIRFNLKTECCFYLKNNTWAPDHRGTVPREPEPLQPRTPTLTSSLEIGSCYDGSDAETGFGVEIGSDLAFPGPGHRLELELNAHDLVAREDSDFRERGVSGTLRWCPDPSSDPSLSMSVTPVHPPRALQ